MLTGLLELEGRGMINKAGGQQVTDVTKGVSDISLHHTGWPQTWNTQGFL